MCDDYYPLEIEDLRKGTAFYWKKAASDTRHLFFILTDPDTVNGKIVVVAVNITGRTEYGLGSDTTVVLNVGDHPFISKPSVVVYKKAMLSDASKIVKYINQEKSLDCYELEDDVFKKVQEGIFESDLTPPEIVEYCRQKF